MADDLQGKVYRHKRTGKTYFVLRSKKVHSKDSNDATWQDAVVYYPADDNALFPIDWYIRSIKDFLEKYEPFVGPEL